MEEVRLLGVACGSVGSDEAAMMARGATGTIVMIYHMEFIMNCLYKGDNTIMEVQLLFCLSDRLIDVHVWVTSRVAKLFDRTLLASLPLAPRPSTAIYLKIVHFKSMNITQAGENIVSC